MAARRRFSIGELAAYRMRQSSIDKVGGYHAGSGASYVPLWLLLAIFGFIGGWGLRRARVQWQSSAT
jgi:hypothetical protein